MRILVVEDEHGIANSIKKGLEQEHYAVDLAYTGTDGYDLAISESYDAIILDLMLPGLDGLTLCQKLRSEGLHTPVLMLTAKSRLQDKITGLDTGADDYLTKPFAFEELLARLRALLRRPRSGVSSVLKVGELTLDTTSYRVTRAGKEITLSSKEYALLEYLVRHPGVILSKDQITAHVWDYDADILPNTVEVYIRKLRQKLDLPFADSKPMLTTVRGFGYKLEG